MALFRPSAQLARCDECRTVFDPVYGGVCARCGRLLCAIHLYGGFLRRLLGHLSPRQAVCVACRAKGGAALGSHPREMHPDRSDHPSE